MTDLWNELTDHCGYIISKICETFEALPSFTSNEKKADIVRAAFISNGGGFGWGVTRNEQIDINADGARLYELINGTSGDTRTLQHFSFAELTQHIEKLIDTSDELPSVKDVFDYVAKDFAERCRGMTYDEIIRRYKGSEPHGGTYAEHWQICYWSDHVEISVPYYRSGQLRFKDYKYKYEKIARAAADKTRTAEIYQLTFDDIGVMHNG